MKAIVREMHAVEHLGFGSSHYAPAMAPHGEAPISRVKDGRAWRIGGDVEVAWIENGTKHGMAITSAIPPVFGAYATVALRCGDDQQAPDDQSDTSRRS